MKFKRAKIYVLIFLGLFIIYFTQDYTLINIEKTALIVTIGVDKNDNGYTVTAQIAVPEGTNSKATNNEAVISSSGKTVYEAVSSISDKTGWYPKLSFCNLIVLGESTLDDNVFDVIDFFVRSYKVEDSAIICATKGEAKELLLSSSPLDNISGLSLSKIFVKDYEYASRVLTTSIKEFCINYYSRSNFGYMPFVKTVMTDESGKGGKTVSTSTTTEPNSGSTSSEGSGQQQLVIYDASTSYLFNNGYKVGELSGDEALCFSLLYKRVKETYLSVNATDENGNTGEILLNILKANNKVELSFNGDTPILNCNVKIWARVIDTSFPQDIKTISKLGTLSENVKYHLKKTVEDNIIKVLNISKETNSDIFEIKNLIYKYYTRKYAKTKLTALEKVKINVNVTPLNYL